MNKADQQNGISDNKKTLRKWSEDHMIAIITLGLIIASGIMLVSTWEKVIEAYKGFEEFYKMIQQNQEYDYERRQVLRYSTDCEELQDAIIFQLSFGANADSWFPSSDDRALKIGQQRYDVMGCKP